MRVRWTHHDGYRRNRRDIRGELRQRLALLGYRVAGWPRRLAALALLAIAAALALRPAHAAVVAAPRQPGVEVLVAARDLRAGTPLGPGDAARARLPPDLVPAGAVHAGTGITGRQLASAVRRGEPFTDVSFVGPSLTRAIGGSQAVAVPLRVSDPDAARLLRAGDSVDVFASAQDSPAALVASGASVMLAASESDERDDGALIVLAVGPRSATKIIAIPPSDRITVTVRAEK